eukprot:scaffold103_cov116-Cylindrotheca_fusiformis.AAC.1
MERRKKQRTRNNPAGSQQQAIRVAERLIQLLSKACVNRNNKNLSQKESVLPVLFVLSLSAVLEKLSDLASIPSSLANTKHQTMGNLLGAPATEKETHVGSTADLKYGLSSMQGWRVHMEDAHIVETSLYYVEDEEENKK